MVVNSKDNSDVKKSSEVRPCCPECGGVNPVSRGDEWKCRVCGRKFQKRYRGVYKHNSFFSLNLNSKDTYFDSVSVKDI